MLHGYFEQSEKHALHIFNDGLSLSNRGQNPTVSVKPKREVVGNTEGSRPDLIGIDPVETTRWPRQNLNI